MDESLTQYEVKLKPLLAKFLDPKFELRNDIYMNSLFSHLSGKHDKELGEKILKLPLLTEWVIQATSLWESGHNQPSKSASMFILQLTSLISIDEKKFTYFKTYNVYNTLCSVLKVKLPETSASVKFGYVNMISSLLHHKSGIDWLISTDNWRDVLNFTLEGQTIYVTRKGQEFMYRLLKESINYNEIFCNLVIKQITMKLAEFPCQNGVYPEVQEETLCKRMEPVLKLINFIFERLLEDPQGDFRIPIIFVVNYKLESTILNLSSVAQNIDFVHELDKILLAITLHHLLMVKSKVIACSEKLKIREGILKIISTKITRNQLFNVLKICQYMYQLWKYILPRFPEPLTEEILLRAENHTLPLQIMPMVGVAIKHCSLAAVDFELDDIRDAYISKIFKSMDESTTRVAFKWKRAVMDQEEMFVLAQYALRLLMNDRKLYNRSRAIILFQSFIYSFKDIIISIKDRNANPEVLIQNSTYVISLINCLSTFINEYNITWTESVETICVLSITLEFINLAIWSPRVIVEALKLLNLSIAKYMSPNLALLVDKTKDSALDQIGPVLLNKLHDISWEVRDSALEVLITISTFSCTKFPSFQSIITGCDFISLVVTMAINDSEGFVRASAVKCLQEMIKVSVFWNPVLIQLELPQKMMAILRNEPEAIVRTEASCLMRCIYEHQAFPSDMMEKVYESMYFAATEDLHWEVKTNALDFWGKVILNHLQDQGMIDGKFPDVTFSKEHKKIVTLTENEIKLRLNKVLYQLSRCGCLGVFITAIQDDCDIEVTRRAVSKLKKVAYLLKHYNVTSDNSEPSSAYSAYSQSESPQSTSGYCTSSYNTPPITPRMECSDDIIDQIVNTSDLGLLTNVFNSNENVPVVNSMVKTGKEVTPETFLKVVESDLDSIVEEKTKWLNNINNLHSLLDDILKKYNSNVNAMDCY